MKITKFIIMAIFMQSFTTAVHSQSIVLINGDLSILKGESRFGILYNYDDMRVGKMTEEDYVNKKVTEANQKIPGRGDKWAASWKADREARFQPKFENLLNKYLKSKNIAASPDIKDSKYSILLKTTFTEPGYNIYVSKMNASIDVEVLFVETANPSNVAIKLTMKRIPGRSAMGDDYDTGGRIEEAYAKCGKDLGAYLVKKVFK